MQVLTSKSADLARLITPLHAPCSTVVQTDSTSLLPNGNENTCVFCHAVLSNSSIDEDICPSCLADRKMQARLENIDSLMALCRDLRPMLSDTLKYLPHSLAREVENSSVDITKALKKLDAR